MIGNGGYANSSKMLPEVFQQDLSWEITEVRLNKLVPQGLPLIASGSDKAEVLGTGCMMRRQLELWQLAMNVTSIS